MRNPLSAILQCSDEITTSLTGYKASDGTKSTEKLLDLLDSSIDAAQTIALCAQHQVSIYCFHLLVQTDYSHRKGLWTIS